MGPTGIQTKKRIIVAFTAVCLLATLLCFRMGWIQIIMADEYSEMAVEQQTRDVPIEAKRGAILDRNGEELAVSAVCYSVWVRPSSVQVGKTEERKAENLERTVTTLSEVLTMDAEEVRALVTKEQALVKVAKYLEKETADKIREAGLPGVEIAEDVKRYYPLGAFASHLLGSVTDDNSGLAGIELKYNQYLSGISGRWIRNTDVWGNGLSFGQEEYYRAEDGYDVVLTIDEVIQNYVEKSMQTVQKNTQADRVLCLMMDPKTADVLAMAVTPEYDPNTPRVPLEEEDAQYVDLLSDADKLVYWNKMWRNPIVSDTYEPGSTFKLLTTAMALEEGVTSLSDTFFCNYTYQVAGQTLHCWQAKGHGHQNLVEAVGNSCNPVFVALSQRVGEDKYYDYLNLFGVSEKTGIDYPGEGNSILQNKATAGPIGLATMSYGQGIAVTPIQLLTAVCAFGNEGKLMQPRLVKELRNSDGKVVNEFKNKEVRQVVSKKTAEEMCLIMEAVVSEGGGGTAKVPGYRVGGKTGTANKVINGAYSDETFSSFIGMAPMDDPQVAILLIVDNPKGVKFGSQTAAPGVKQILSDVMRYYQIEPQYTEEELKTKNSQTAVVPSITGESFSVVIGRLGGAGLNYKVVPENGGGADFIVVDQYPKAGEKIAKGGTIYIYRE